MPSSPAGARFAILVLATVAVLTTAVSAEVDQSATVQSGSAATAAPDAAELRRSLAEADIRWIANKTGWRTVSVPRIEIRSGADLALMFFGIAEGLDGVKPLALYARDERILFLSDQLTLDNLPDKSILLHELVHHMQVINAIAFDCREETEKQAYRLQIEWLREHGVAQPYAFIGISEVQIDGLICP